jgi:signal transduction histidine kinase
MGVPAASSHAEVVELIAELLSEISEDAPPDAFYDRLCEAVCRLTAMRRAVIFRYDDARRRVRAAGAHGIELARFAELHVTVESVPVARQALAEDRVLEVSGVEDLDLPESWRSWVADLHLVVTPMSAAGRWVGVILSDREESAPALSESDRQLLMTLGKTTALAAAARFATTQLERSRQLEQRLDLAREIHESVLQRLFGVSLALSAEEGLSPAAQRRCGEELQAALGELRAALQRPLGRTPRPTAATLAEELERLARAHPDLHVELHEGDPRAVPEHLQPLCQSVLAEAIRNAHKHAEPSRVTVSLRHAEGTFVLEVANDGIGESPPRGGGGVGLRLAALEALGLGGVVEFGQRDRQWQVRLVVPDR